MAESLQQPFVESNEAGPVSLYEFSVVDPDAEAASIAGHQ